MTENKYTCHSTTIEEPGCETEEIYKAENVARNNHNDGHKSLQTDVNTVSTVMNSKTNLYKC